MFYLIRHGATDYTERNTKIFQGFGVNFAPLSAEGIAQIKLTAKDARLQGADIIVSSPYTRALQSAAILSKQLQVDIAVETDLHEWLENKNYIPEPDEQEKSNHEEYLSSAGRYPDGVERDWEDTARLRERLTAVLSRYRQYHKVLVVCHGMIMQSVNGYPVANGEIVELDFV